jgi:hypothetical protein
VTVLWIMRHALRASALRIAIVIADLNESFRILL